MIKIKKNILGTEQMVGAFDLCLLKHKLKITSTNNTNRMICWFESFLYFTMRGNCCVVEFTIKYTLKIANNKLEKDSNQTLAKKLKIITVS